MKNIRVLVVDDASFMRDMARKALRAGYPGFRIEEASNAKTALHMLRKGDYDLILCDWEMPEMTGLELLREIRENERLKGLPFIMVTSRGDKEHVIQAVQMKANNYIVKPYTTEKLVTVVGNVLSKALGVGIHELRGAGGGMQGGVPGGSAAVLTQYSSSSGGKPKGGQAVVRPSGKVVVTLRFSDESLPCLVKEIGRERLQGVIRRGGSLPAILDLAVIDIDFDGKVSRLNGYVHTLQAREDSRESEFVNVIIRLVDQDDEDKMRHLEAYMASLK